MKKFKCKYCHEFIEEVDLVQPQKKDKQGNLKFKIVKKTGEKIPDTFNAHRKCWEEAQKPKPVQCAYCKKLIFRDKDNFVTITSKSGETHRYAHKECYEDQQKENTAWTNLYEYVREKYFDVEVPNNATIRLKDLRNGSNRLAGIIKVKQGYSYETILNCFKEYEETIEKSIAGKSFRNDNVKANYIMTIIENNISTFVKDEKARQIETQIESKKTECNLHFNISKIQEKIYQQQENNEEDYDILD